MPTRIPSKIVQLNDAINFPVVSSLNIEVDDVENLFGTSSGVRGYKNLDEVLAQLYHSGVSMGGGGLGSGIEVLHNGINLGSFSQINFSGIDITAKEQTPDTAIVIVDPSLRIEDDGIFIDRAKTINFSGTAFTRVSVEDGVATVIVTTSGVSGISGMNIQDEDIAVGQFSTMNFSGVNVVARQDGAKLSVLVRDSSEDGGAALAWYLS